MAYDKLTDRRFWQTLEKVRAHVEAAREEQRLCFLNTGLACNADTFGGPAEVRAGCQRDGKPGIVDWRRYRP